MSEPASAAGRGPATPGEVRSVPVPDGLDGLRVDVALSRLFGLSRTAAADIVERGRVTFDGAACDKAAKVAAGGWLEVELPPPPRPPAAEPVPVAGLVVLHRDDDLVVIDKPAGVAAHPSPGYEGPTVVGALAAIGLEPAGVGADERQGVVHRLDAGTSGVMVVARSPRGYTALKRAFRERTVDKRYHALVQGHPDPLRGTVDAPIDRHPHHPFKFAVVAGGRDSVTHYETIEAMRAATLLDVHLETGRTHQIRVHFSALRHPCVGDTMYGADPVLAERLGLARQWLHAVSLGFAHPADGSWVEFRSDYPADLSAVLDRLRAES